MPPLSTGINYLRERYQFYNRRPKVNESIDKFAEAVQQLAESCGFGESEEWIVRDYVLFALNDKKITLEIVEQGGNPSIQDVIEMCKAIMQDTNADTQHAKQLQRTAQRGRISFLE